MNRAISIIVAVILTAQANGQVCVNGVCYPNAQAVPAATGYEWKKGKWDGHLDLYQGGRPIGVLDPKGEYHRYLGPNLLSGPEKPPIDPPDETSKPAETPTIGQGTDSWRTQGINPADVAKNGPRYSLSGNQASQEELLMAFQAKNSDLADDSKLPMLLFAGTEAEQKKMREAWEKSHLFKDYQGLVRFATRLPSDPALIQRGFTPDRGFVAPYSILQAADGMALGMPLVQPTEAQIAENLRRIKPFERGWSIFDGIFGNMIDLVAAVAGLLCLGPMGLILLVLVIWIIVRNNRNNQPPAGAVQ